MNSFGWLLVLVPVAVVGIYLLCQRRRAATPFNSISKLAVAPGPDEMSGASHDATNDPEVQRPRHHGGCCGITR